MLGVLAACGSTASNGPPKTSFGPEGMAVENGVLLAPARAIKTPVDGLICNRPTLEFHEHAHLAVYVDGALRPIPSAVGIFKPKYEQTETGPDVADGECFYSLHTHAQDGVIHLEGPERKVFTLGQFFDIWGQPLSATQVGPFSGRVTVLVDGRPSSGDPRDIVLVEHRTIQLMIGKDVEPMPVDWSHF